MSSNMQRLGATLSNRMKKTSNAAVPTTIELGRVNANLSITTDSLQTPIPKGEYMVNLMLSGSFATGSSSHSHDGGTHGGHEEGDGSHIHGGGSHGHSIRGIKPGDRILIAWCGYEPVVIAVLDASTTITYTTDDSPSEGGSDDSGPGGTEPGGSGSSGSGGTGGAGNEGKDYFTSEEVEAIVQETVNRVTAIFEEKFYTKIQIDEKLSIATDEEISEMLDKFYSDDDE